MSKLRLIAACASVVPLMVVTTYLGWADHEWDWLSIAVSLVLVSAFLFLVCLFVGGKINQTEQDSEYVNSIMGMRRVLAAHAAFFFPRSAACWCCHMPWALTHRHITSVPGLFGERDNSVWALCRYCYTHLGVDDRTRYYAHMMADLIAKGVETHSPEWERVRASLWQEWSSEQGHKEEEQQAA